MPKPLRHDYTFLIGLTAQAGSTAYAQTSNVREEAVGKSVAITALLIQI